MVAGPPWKERPVDLVVRQTLEERGISPILARLLAARGLLPESIDAFFDPALARLVRAAQLPGIPAATDVILPYVSAHRKIVVFGDYDADGVCASAILVRTLRKLGGVAEAFIPGRFTEGYGMTEASLARLLAEQPDVALVITVDNGITAPREIEALKTRGIAVVVTDHHLPGSELPASDALVNPRVAAAPGCEGLCGAGVAFFLAAALAQEAAARGLYSGGKFAGPLLVLAGLATVADLMPLTDQNRILVTQALSAFRTCAPVGLRELYDRAARRAAPLGARDFGFMLAPRINAAGRMDTARVAYELLMTEDREEARQLAMKVDSFNALRKTEELRMEQAVREQCGALEGVAAVVARGEDWHSGVAGIVAARVMETAHVPVAVVVGDHGSARAPDGYNVHDALTAAAGTLVRFGGHAAAGGFTVQPGRYDEFKRLFADACAAQCAAAPDAAAVAFDGWVEPSDLTLGLCGELTRLEPFGEGNPEPVFGLQDVAFADIRPMGIDGRHVSFSFVNRSIPRAVWWNHGCDAEELRAHAAARFDLLFTLLASDYGPDGPVPELRLVAVRPH
ncbi:MAG: single-stranded-DNA-specific exonuclease RecJ [Kiritimatiellae bacterium]|nr:single-stranded-DNA-specific exonuclease RecJ [Kiritimatiellia bacterium]